MKEQSVGKLKTMQGMATMEMMIAMALLVLVICSILPLVSGAESIFVSTELSQAALYKARDNLELERAKSRDDFLSVLSWDDPATDDIYTENVTVTEIDSSTKQVVSNVAWDAENRDLDLSLTTRLTNFDIEKDTCSQTLEGDWSNPQVLGTADVGENNGGTDVDIYFHKAYITADPASDPETANKADFYIVDVSDPNPAKGTLPILGSLDTGPGLASVQVAGRHAFVANKSAVSQLQIIDISDSEDPQLITALDVTPSGDTAVGRSIFYTERKVYLGLTKYAEGPEFYVIDVSVPTNPSILASFETNTQVTNIVVRNGIAYLAVPDDPDTEDINEQLRVLDVSQADAGIIRQLYVFSPENPTTMSGQGLYLSEDGNTLYFSEVGAQNPEGSPQLFVLNVSNPANVSIQKSKYIGTAKDVSVRSVLARDNLIFIVDSDPNKDFQIWNLDDLGPNSNYYSYLNVEQSSTGGMDCEGNYIFIAQRSNKALQVIGSGN